MEKKFYEVKFTESAEKDLKKLNKSIAKLLKKWISENLIGTQNPKQRGKALTGNLKGLWRYRVGSYRIVAEIKNNKNSSLYRLLFLLPHGSFNL